MHANSSLRFAGICPRSGGRSPICRRKVSGGNRPRPRLRLRPRPLLRPDRTVPPRRGIRPGSGSPLGNSGRGPGGAGRRNTMFWVLRIFRFDFRRRGRLFGGRCSAPCFMPRSVSPGSSSGRSAGSGVWCSCTAFHAAPVIEEQVRMACVPHSSCLFQIGPAERQHRAASPAGCPSYLHCTAVCSAQRRQSPPPAAAGRGHKDFAGGRSAGTFDASRLRGRGGSGRSALADSYSIGRMRTSATPFKARSRRSRSVFSSTSP